MKKFLKPGWLYLIFVLFGAGVVCRIDQIEDLGRAFRCVLTLIALVAVAFAGITVFDRMRDKKWNEKPAIIAVLTTSFLVRAYYILYTPTWVRQHDVIGFGAGFGQAAFIEYFYEKIRLIDFDPRQFWGFFQPPLHHMLAGLWLRLQVAVGYSYGHACENVQVLILIYASLLSYFGLRILKQCKVSGEALVFSEMLIALHPSFIIMAGSINNDMLCTLLSVMTIFYFLRYLQKERTADLLLTALCLGLSMMAKQSGILMAPAIGCLLAARFVGAIRRKETERIKRYVLTYVAFGAVSIPIGIWSPLRNLIKFGVPLNFTPEVGEPLAQSAAARIFDVRTDTPFTRMIGSGHAFDEFNVPLAYLKTGFFGEYTFAQVSKFATLLGWVILLTGTVLTLWYFYRTMVDIIPTLRVKTSSENGIQHTETACEDSGEMADSCNAEVSWFMFILTGTALLFYVNLCFSIPNFSSQDFRYISFLVVVQALVLGKRLGEMKPACRRVMEGIIFAFAMACVGLYLLVGRVIW